MNLVAKEYLASQNADDPGVLVLSRFAGAAKECEAALLVNPYDSESVANAIVRALSMPLEERRERHKSIMRVLAGNDIKFWGEKFLTALELTYDEMTMFADMAAPSRSHMEKMRQKTA
jgi:trehalose 6-phosphate synthase